MGPAGHHPQQECRLKTLTLAKDLKLPADEAVAQKYAFIGRSDELFD